MKNYLLLSLSLSLLLTLNLFSQSITSLAPDDLQEGDDFGQSVALWQERAAVGARGDDAAAPNAGAVYVYALQNGEWQPEAVLQAEQPQAGEQLGQSVALRGNTLAAGARYADAAAEDAGAVLVFERQGGAWVQTARLTASDGEQNDQFGTRVVLGDDLLLVGVPLEDELGTTAGAVYVFERESGEWVQTAKLTASDGSGFNRFGQGLDTDEQRILVGAWGNDNFLGAAYVFEREDGAWVETGKLTPPDGTFGNRFGWSVSLQGDLAAVGSPYFETVLGWPAGTVYVFSHVDGEWIWEGRVDEGEDSFGADLLGHAVALCDSFLIAGAPSEGKWEGTDSGKMYVYEKEEDEWVKRWELEVDPPEEKARLGWGLSCSSGRVLGGYNNQFNEGGGGAFIFDLLLTTSLQEPQRREAGFDLFPNPARDRVNVRLPLAPVQGELLLYDQLGRRLRQWVVEQPGLLQLNLGDLEPGLYYLSLHDQASGRHISRKLVVQ